MPVYFSYADAHLCLFSMSGRKIDFMRANPQVSLLVEERGQGREWQSVIIDGHFEELPDRFGHKRERNRAWSLLSRHFDWWEPGALKPVAPPQPADPEHIFFRIMEEHPSDREAKEI